MHRTVFFSMIILALAVGCGRWSTGSNMLPNGTSISSSDIQSARVLKVTRRGVVVYDITHPQPEATHTNPNDGTVYPGDTVMIAVQGSNAPKCNVQTYQVEPGTIWTGAGFPASPAPTNVAAAFSPSSTTTAAAGLGVSTNTMDVTLPYQIAPSQNQYYMAFSYVESGQSAQNSPCPAQSVQQNGAIFSVNEPPAVLYDVANGQNLALGSTPSAGNATATPYIRIAGELITFQVGNSVSTAIPQPTYLLNITLNGAVSSYNLTNASSAPINYVTFAPSATPTQMLYPSILSVFYTTSQSISASVETKQNGIDTMSGTIPIMIVTPNATVVYQTPAPMSVATYPGNCDANGLYIALIPPCPGISWSMNGSLPSEPPTSTPNPPIVYTSAKVGVVQLTNFQQIVTPASGSPVTSGTCSSYQLDGSDFYAMNVQKSAPNAPFSLPFSSTLTGDSPGIPLSSGNLSEKMTTSFEDYFMYKSGRPGSIFIALSMYQWQANGTSTYSGGQWSALTNASGPSLQNQALPTIALPTASAIYIPNNSHC